MTQWTAFLQVLQELYLNLGTWIFDQLEYCKFPKYLDTPKICCNHSKIWVMWLYRRIMSPDDADGMANSADPDQSVPRTSLIWACTVYPGISVQKLRIITVGTRTGVYETLCPQNMFASKNNLETSC